MDEREKWQSLRCKIYPEGTLSSYRFVVVCARYEGRWMLSRHKRRDTWETQGGHIERGETPMETAVRELFEESGVSDAALYPVCDYLGYDDFGSATGVVFLADVHSLGTLPESEMKEVRMFEFLPEQLTYPAVTPRLMAEAFRMAREKGIL